MTFVSCYRSSTTTSSSSSTTTRTTTRTRTRTIVSAQQTTKISSRRRQEQLWRILITNNEIVPSVKRKSKSDLMIRSALYQGIPSTSSKRYDSDNNNNDNNSWDPLGLLLLNDREGLGFALVDKFGFNNTTKNDRERSKTTTTSRRSKSNDKKKKNSKNDNDDDDNKSSSRSLTKTSAFGSSSSSSSMGGNNNNNDDGSFGDFFKGDLPQKVATILALLVVSRIGAYIPISGVDRTAFAESLQNTGGMMSYVDTLTGGSISKLGIFSLGIVPFINSSIIFQLLSSVFPELQKLQKEEGESGRRQFMQYQRYGALAFALIQAVGQCLYVRPYVEDFSAMWLFESTAVLTAGAMILMYIGEVLNELKLGNGTSLLIFANIVSSLPSSIGQTLEQSKTDGNGYFTLAVFFGAFLLSTLGVVYVQEAERKIPMQYSSKFDSGAAGLSKSSYLPFKVNSAGVMPIIFASSLMALPATLARFTDNGAVMSVAKFIYPGGVGYIPVNVALICFFNYFYTFLQLDPKDVAEQLKKQGASIPGVRPGKNTREYITRVLERLSLLGSVFLGVLALTPGGVEKLTGLQTFRGFAGTSLLILVGVATDSARKVKSELVMQKYSTSIEDFYKK